MHKKHKHSVAYRTPSSTILDLESQLNDHVTVDLATADLLWFLSWQYGLDSPFMVCEITDYST